MSGLIGWQWRKRSREEHACALGLVESAVVRRNIPADGERALQWQRCPLTQNTGQRSPIPRPDELFTTLHHRRDQMAPKRKATAKTSNRKSMTKKKKNR